MIHKVYTNLSARFENAYPSKGAPTLHACLALCLSFFLLKCLHFFFNSLVYSPFSLQKLLSCNCICVCRCLCLCFSFSFFFFQKSSIFTFLFAQTGVLQKSSHRLPPSALDKPCLAPDKIKINLQICNLSSSNCKNAPCKKKINLQICKCKCKNVFRKGLISGYFQFSLFAKQLLPHRPKVLLFVDWEVTMKLQYV